MDEYIATFYSHFGAVRFKKNLSGSGIDGTIMPVPRDLSSSCGTCVRYQSEEGIVDDPYEEIEQVVRVSGDNYICIYRAADS